MNHKPLEITEIVDEGKDIKTFLFDEDIEARPGQFVIAYIPEAAEKPFSLSYTKPLGITVKKRKLPSSIFTPALFELEEGDKVWIRGPYGNGFPSFRYFKFKDVCIIGGGTGIAPLALLAEYIHKNSLGSQITSFLGAKSSDELIFEKRLEKVGDVRIVTEDGSKGERGLVTDPLKRYEFSEKSKAAVCGPENMIYNSVKILENYLESKNIYISLERYMKCGRGLCGSCDFGGFRTCVDGPVFSYNQIKPIEDFGKFRKDRAGRKDFTL